MFSVPLLISRLKGTGNVPLWLWCFPGQRCLGVTVSPMEGSSWGLCEPLGAAACLGRAHRGLMLWDPSLRLLWLEESSRALSGAGVSPRNPCRGCKSTWMRAAFGRGVNEPRCQHRTICNQPWRLSCPTLPGMCLLTGLHLQGTGLCLAPGWAASMAVQGLGRTGEMQIKLLSRGTEVTLPKLFIEGKC